MKLQPISYQFQMTQDIYEFLIFWFPLVRKTFGKENTLRVYKESGLQVSQT